MAVLKNSRHEKFAQAVASGSSGSEAYRQVVGAGAGKNADVMADQLMNQHGVRERVNELKEANSRKATLSREQTIEFLCNVIKTSAANVEVDSPLVQSAEFVDGKPVKFRIPDKIAAAKELTRDMRLGAAESYRTVGYRHARRIRPLNPRGAEAARHAGLGGS